MPNIPKIPGIPGIPNIPGLIQPQIEKKELFIIPPSDLETKKINLLQINKNKLQFTFWNNKLEKKAKIDYEMLLKHFAEPKKKDIKVSTKDLKMTEDKVKVLDDKKLMNLGIGLAKVQLNNNDLKNILTNIDYKRISVEIIDQLMPLLPSKEDTDAFKRFDGDVNTLSSGEIFTKILIDIPKHKELLEFIKIQLNLNNDIQEIIRKINMLSECFDCLNSSNQFQRLLIIILDISNYLNHGSRFGNIQGFSISSLSNLETVKSFTNKTFNFYDFLIENLKQNEPILLNFHKDILLRIDIDYEDIKSNITSVESLLKKIRKEKLEQEELKEKTEFNSLFISFLSNLEIDLCSKIDQIVFLKTKLDEKINSFCLLYGEDQSKIKIDAVFKIIINFVSKFKECCNKHLKQESDLNKKEKAKKTKNDKNDKSDKNLLPVAQAVNITSTVTRITKDRKTVVKHKDNVIITNKLKKKEVGVSSYNHSELRKTVMNKNKIKNTVLSKIELSSEEEESLIDGFLK